MPISSPRDANRTPMIMGTLDSDGSTPTLIQVNPTNHKVKYDDNTGGSSFPAVNAQRDANRIPVIWGVSSEDGVTPVYIAVDSSGNLLVNSM